MSASERKCGHRQVPGRFEIYECAPWLGTPARREDDDDRAWLRPVHEIDDVLVGHADAYWIEAIPDKHGDGCEIPYFAMSQKSDSKSAL